MTDRHDRVEVVTRVQRYQRWSWEDKGRIVAESEASGSSFAKVADRHGIQAAQIYVWRKLLRRKAVGDAVHFAPVRVAEGSLAGMVGAAQIKTKVVTGAAIGGSKTRHDDDVGSIDVWIGDSITVRISGLIAVETLSAVFTALRSA